MTVDSNHGALRCGDRTEWPEVAVVILNWNNYDDTFVCLDSLENIDYPNFNVIVVDNGSTDNSGKALEENFEWCDFIFNDENLGFAAGCNVGIEHAMDDGMDYILLLNNDTILSDPDFLKRGIEVAESRADSGIVGGKILNHPNTNQIWSTGGFTNFWGDVNYVGHGECDDGQYGDISHRDFISGALMLIKRDTIEEVGLLPEVYFFGKEDWEYSLRARESGFKLLYSPDFRVYHKVGDSHDSTDPAYIYNSTLSKIIYKRRNLPRYKYYVWIALYRIYLGFLLPIRCYYSGFDHCIPSDEFISAMRQAGKDAQNTTKITKDSIENFRLNDE